jgi:hypothetical protein
MVFQTAKTKISRDDIAWNLTRYIELGSLKFIDSQDGCTQAGLLCIWLDQLIKASTFLIIYIKF